MLRNLATLARLFQILKTLAREDALGYYQPQGPLAVLVATIKFIWGRKKKGRPGEKLAKALTDLGPTFIKLGQALSVRADLIGKKMASDLSHLQDQLPPFDSQIARAIIQREFDASVENLFAEFSNAPIAAASIAQVHKARTIDGRAVAVKILRPDIHTIFEKDIALFHKLATMAETYIPPLRRLRPVDVVATFAKWVRTEMDLRLEGASASEFARNATNEKGFRVPQVDWNLTSQSVLTTEWIEGIRIDDEDGLNKAGINRNDLLEKSSEIFFLQVFRDGFFHADMHPGNLFIDPDGNIVPVDFGIMGRVDKKTRYFLADTLIGFLQHDYGRVADVHFAVGYVPADQDRNAFKQAIWAIGEPLLDKTLNEISIGRLLGDLFQTTERFHMQTQPDLLLLQKTILVAEGVGRMINPDVNMWVLARPLIEKWMIANRSPEARMVDNIKNFVGLIESLPENIRKTDRILSRLDQLDIKEKSGKAFDSKGKVRYLSFYILAALMGGAISYLAMMYFR